MLLLHAYWTINSILWSSNPGIVNPLAHWSELNNMWASWESQLYKQNSFQKLGIANSHGWYHDQNLMHKVIFHISVGNMSHLNTPVYRRIHYFVDWLRQGTIERFVRQCLDTSDYFTTQIWCSIGWIRYFEIFHTFNRLFYP